jgi:hypothetical protein
MARINSVEALVGFIDLLTYTGLDDPPSSELDDDERAREQASLVFRKSVQSDITALSQKLGYLVFEDPAWFDTHSPSQIEDVLDRWLSDQEAGWIAQTMIHYFTDPEASATDAEAFLEWFGQIVSGWEQLYASQPQDDASAQAGAVQSTDNPDFTRYAVPGTERMAYWGNQWLYGSNDPGTDWVTLEERYSGFAGFLLLSPALVAILYGLSQAATGDGFASDGAWAPLAAGVALAVGYLIHSLRRPGRSLVDLRLFAIRSFGAAGSVLFFSGLSLYAAMFLLPLYYQEVRGQDALATDLLLAPQGLGALRPAFGPMAPPRSPTSLRSATLHTYALEHSEHFGYFPAARVVTRCAESTAGGPVPMMITEFGVIS